MGKTDRKSQMGGPDEGGRAKGVRLRAEGEKKEGTVQEAVSFCAQSKQGIDAEK